MTNCMLCGRSTKELFACRDYASEKLESYPLLWCAACEFGRLDGQFTPELVSSFYSADYYTHNNATVVQSRSTFLDRVMMKLAWTMDAGRAFSPDELSPKTRVLDIGCGDGSILSRFKTLGYETFGVEPDPIALENARRYGVIYPGTAESLPEELRNQKFDVVLMSHVLEHCVDPERAVSNAAELLDEDGTLVIEVPNNAALGFWMFRAMWPWTDIPRHLSFFSERSLCSLLAKHDFRDVSPSYVGFSRQFARPWREKQLEIRRSISGSGFFTLRGWVLLLFSLFVGPQRKYDSVRVQARFKRP